MFSDQNAPPFIGLVIIDIAASSGKCCAKDQLRLHAFVVGGMLYISKLKYALRQCLTRTQMSESESS